MPGTVPTLSFRVPSSFSVRPPLEAQKGVGGTIVLGETTSSDESVEAIFVGKAAERPYEPIWVDTEGAHVVYVMGKRRSGKSYTLGVLAEGLATNDWMRQGVGGQGVLILDTMNVYLTMPFAREDVDARTGEQQREHAKWQLGKRSVAVRLFRPRGSTAPPGLQVEEFALRPSDLGPEEWCGLFGVDPLADPLGHLMMELHGRVALDGYRNARDGRDVPANRRFRLLDLLLALDVDPAFDDYHRDTRESLRRRLTALSRLPLFSDTGLNVRELLRPDVISVLLLRDLDHNLRSVLVGYVVRQVMQGRAEADTHERLLPIYERRADALRTEDPQAAADAELLVAECKSQIELGLPRSWLIRLFTCRGGWGGSEAES